MVDSSVGRVLMSATTSSSEMRWLLLPVETKARELDGKAFLAFEAAEHGWGVILGRGIRDKPYLPKGVFVENSISPGRAPDIVASQEKDRLVVAWCEEGVVYLNAEEYGRRRVEKTSFDLIDAYFAWGQQQSTDLTSTLACDARKIVVSGNPRFDLLRSDIRGVFSKKVDAIQNRFGSFILVNTKFAMYNNYIGEDFFIDAMRRRGKFKTPEQEARQKENREFQKKTFLAFQEAIVALSAAQPGHKIVVRPHPSESHDPWNVLAAQHDNIEVIFEGNVAEWILASEVCIHNNCTTAVEACLLDRPTLSYRPFKDERFDAYLPHALSDEAETIAELNEWVTSALSGSHPTSAQAQRDRKKIVERYVSGQSAHTASQTIMETLGQLDVPADRLEIGTAARKPLSERFAASLRPVKQLLHSPEKLAKRRYTAQKFPGLQASEVQEFLDESQRVTGRFQGIEVEEIDTNIMRIQRR